MNQHIKTKNVRGEDIEFYIFGINGDFIRDIDNYSSKKFDWPDDLSDVSVMLTISKNDDTWFYISTNEKLLFCGVWDLPLPNITKNCETVEI